MLFLDVLNIFVIDFSWFTQLQNTGINFFILYLNFNLAGPKFHKKVNVIF